MIDKRKLRLILPCEDYGVCWIKGAHINDEKEVFDFLQNHKYFNGQIIESVEIDNHGYCYKMIQKDCDNPYDWVCEGDYAWFDCSKELKGSIPYTSVQFQTELRTIKQEQP